VRGGVAWIQSWHAAQTMRVLRRIFAMSAAHAGWPGPGSPSIPQGGRVFRGDLGAAPVPPPRSPWSSGAPVDLVPSAPVPAQRSECLICRPVPVRTLHTCKSSQPAGCQQLFTAQVRATCVGQDHGSKVPLTPSGCPETRKVLRSGIP
jgi:hypothetical protein